MDFWIHRGFDPGGARQSTSSLDIKNSLPIFSYSLELLTRSGAGGSDHLAMGVVMAIQSLLYLVIESIQEEFEGSGFSGIGCRWCSSSTTCTQPIAR